MSADFWSLVPRFGTRPKVWTEPFHEIDRLEAERGPLDTKDRPEAESKALATFKRSLAKRRKKK